MMQRFWFCLFSFFSLLVFSKPRGPSCCAAVSSWKDAEAACSRQQQLGVHSSGGPGAGLRHQGGSVCLAAEPDQRPSEEWRCGGHCAAVVLSLFFTVVNTSSLSGAELLVEQLGPGVLARQKDNPNLYLVGASWQRLLSGAEDLGLFKEYSDGSMRGFTWANKHNFKDFKGRKFLPLCSSVC